MKSGEGEFHEDHTQIYESLLLACIIMAIELFGVECGVYVAIACVISYLLSGHTSIYGKQMIGEPKNRRFSNHQGKRLTELNGNHK